MGQKRGPEKEPADHVVKEIRRAKRRAAALRQNYRANRPKIGTRREFYRSPCVCARQSIPLLSGGR
jgi:hypothetical protein